MMECGALTIKGKIRANDEDSIYCGFMKYASEGLENSIQIGFVADGMGGGEMGEMASKIVVSTMVKNLGNLISNVTLNSKNIKDYFNFSIEDANNLIAKFKRDHNINTMGTTITGGLIANDIAYIINVGDSRTYLISKNGKVKTKTKDHSYVQELLDKGFIREEEVRTHPQRNIVTRVVDGTEDANPDFYEWKIYKGDSILICCDGLWETLDDEIIAKTIALGPNMDNTVKLLVETANDLDGSDNISAVGIKKLEGEYEDEIKNIPTRKFQINKGVF